MQSIHERLRRIKAAVTSLGARGRSIAAYGKGASGFGRISPLPQLYTICPSWVHRTLSWIATTLSSRCSRRRLWLVWLSVVYADRPLSEVTATYQLRGSRVRNQRLNAPHVCLDSTRLHCGDSRATAPHVRMGAERLVALRSMPDWPKWRNSTFNR